MVDPGARMESEVSGPNVWLELNKKAGTKVQGFITRNKVGILIKPVSYTHLTLPPKRIV